MKGVFFDLYGTLMVYGDMDRAWEEWLTYTHVELAARGAAIDRAALRSRCDGLFSQDAPPKNNRHLTLYERRLERLMVQLGLRLDDGDLQSIAKGSIAAWARYTHLDPHAIDLLAELQQTKILALVSNFDHPPHVHGLLEDLCLTPFFHTVIVSGEVGIQKPDPAIFRLALKRTGLQPTEALYLGDMLKEDIQGSRRAGLTPVLIDRSAARDADGLSQDKAPQPPDGIHRVESLKAFEALVQTLDAS